MTCTGRQREIEEFCRPRQWCNRFPFQAQSGHLPAEPRVQCHGGIKQTVGPWESSAVKDVPGAVEDHAAVGNAVAVEVGHVGRVPQTKSAHWGAELKPSPLPSSTLTVAAKLLATIMLAGHRR